MSPCVVGPVWSNASQRPSWDQEVTFWSVVDVVKRCGSPLPSVNWRNRLRGFVRSELNATNFPSGLATGR